MRSLLAAIISLLALVPAHADWRIIWADEFNGPPGTAPDHAKWSYDLGAGGWGNEELEIYTSRPANVFQDGDGNLVIRSVRMPDGSFTSARLKTKGHFTVQYGRIEARIKIPYGQGIWPAFWMLGDDIKSAGWPKCGEIDIMENIGKEPSIVHGSMHGPGYSGNTPLTEKFELPAGQRFADDFHVYGVEWSPDTVIFSVDGHAYYTVTPANVPTGKKWVYDHPFFLILNVAVGGSWPGSPDSTSVFPQNMLVDWVHVWQNTSVIPAKHQ